jgi:hypothetical protein
MGSHEAKENIMWRDDDDADGTWVYGEQKQQQQLPWFVFLRAELLIYFSFRF